MYTDPRSLSLSVSLFLSLSLSLYIYIYIYIPDRKNYDYFLSSKASS